MNLTSMYAAANLRTSDVEKRKYPLGLTLLLQLATAHPQFDWTARRPADWQRMPEELNATRYMKKAERESRVPSWFVFHRKPG